MCLLRDVSVRGVRARRGLLVTVLQVEISMGVSTAEVVSAVLAILNPENAALATLTEVNPGSAVLGVLMAEVQQGEAEVLLLMLAQPIREITMVEILTTEMVIVVDTKETVTTEITKRTENHHVAISRVTICMVYHLSG